MRLSSGKAWKQLRFAASWILECIYMTKNRLAHGALQNARGSDGWGSGDGGTVNIDSRETQLRSLSSDRCTPRPMGGIDTFVSEGRAPDSVKTLQIYEMQCVDCDNRPAHTLESPSRGMDDALVLGEIATGLSFIKKKDGTLKCE